MSINRKGSRRIVVDGIEYWWRIRRKGTYSQTDYGNGTLNIAVVFSEGEGSTLVINTNKPHPHDWATATPVPVTPSEIVIWIREALKLGWQPAKAGKQFKINVLDL